LRRRPVSFRLVDEADGDESGEQRFGEHAEPREDVMSRAIGSMGRGRALWAARISVALLSLAALPPLAWAQGPLPPRQLAPGVEVRIPPDVKAAETLSVQEMVELTAIPGVEWTPNYLSESRTLYALAKDAQFERTVWCLEFHFKPVRLIYVDIPQPSGKMQRKPIWYLVYRVKNIGAAMAPSVDVQQGFVPVDEPGPVRFVPRFVLESLEYQKAYLDRIIPAALGPIQLRERTPTRMLSTVEMAGQEIPLSDERIDRSVWGVAMWEDVDPRVDFFVIYVEGLTNAYQFVDPPGEYAFGDPPGKGRRFLWKNLQLNFWRPGDERNDLVNEIRFGTPEGEAERYGVPEGVDYTWVYR
jgi:hypothetical protein